MFWQLGPLFTLYIAGVLSANLAVVNVLPFPPLDGGRMLMITLKRFFGSRISLRAEQMTYVVGFVFLFGVHHLGHGVRHRPDRGRRHMTSILRPMRSTERARTSERP